MAHEDIRGASMDTVLSKIGARDDPYPRIVEIHPTDRCNQSCTYCFNRGLSAFSDLRGGQPKPLTLARYRSLFAEMAALGCTHLSISGGGEPFCDPRVMQIIRLARSARLQVRLVTNGTRITAAELPELVRLNEIRVSIDAATAETYGKVRRTDSSQFHALLGTLRRLVFLRNLEKTSLSIGATFLVSALNQHEVKPFATLMSEIGVDRVLFKRDILADDAPSRREPAEAENVVDGATGGTHVQFRHAHINSGVEHASCFIPFFKVAIDPYGDIFSCGLASQPGVTTGYVLGSLLQGSLMEIWLQSRGLRVRMKLGNIGCPRCSHTDHALNTAMEAAFTRLMQRRKA